MFLVKTMINQTIEKLKSKLEKFFEGGAVNIDHAEEWLGREISAAVLELLSGFYEQVDQELLADKGRRRAAGLSVERPDAAWTTGVPTDLLPKEGWELLPPCR